MKFHRVSPGYYVSANQRYYVSCGRVEGPKGGLSQVRWDWGTISPQGDYRGLGVADTKAEAIRAARHHSGT